MGWAGHAMVGTVEGRCMLHVPCWGYSGVRYGDAMSCFFTAGIPIRAAAMISGKPQRHEDR